jgi:Flp pilus assembly protein TadD
MESGAAEAHNKLYREATELCRPLIYMDLARRNQALTAEEEGRLRRALTLFDDALRIWPSNSAAMFFKGKVLQRLDRHEEARKQFELAFRVDPRQAGIAREVALEAGELGDGASAVRFCKIAVSLSPRDAGLVANLSVAFLISGQLEDAAGAANEAARMDPKDRVPRAIAKVIAEVKSGRRAQPRSLRQLEGRK